MLYTSNNSENYDSLDYKSKTSIIRSKFDKNKETKVLIHGFGSSCLTKEFKLLINTLLQEVSFIFFLELLITLS